VTQPQLTQLLLLVIMMTVEKSYFHRRSTDKDMTSLLLFYANPKLPVYVWIVFNENRDVDCMFNKNLAIANRSRVSCINTNNNTMTLKSGLEVTQGH